MSATPPTNPPTPATPDTPPPAYDRTPADHEALFASVVWFRQQEWAGLADQYAGLYVAVLGEKVIDSDRDKDALIRRVQALGDTINQNRVLLQYLPTWEESRLH